MSTDLRNSILLWLGAIVAAGIFWLALRYDLAPPAIPRELLWLIIGIGIGTNVVAPLGRAIGDRLQRRSAKSP